MKIVETAKEVYVDPSALLKLYLREPESRAMAQWRARHPPALMVTHHGHVELINSIGLAWHRKFVSKTTHDAALGALDDDFAQGRYRQADLLWRAALRRAEMLSRTHTPELGCRTLDVLHVASAVELDFKWFMSFDRRQRLLATAAGLKLASPN